MSFLPTKGLEYILVLAYLALLVPFWMAVQRTRERRATLGVVRSRVAAAGNWFGIPDDVYLHRGHSWARGVSDEAVEVGMDSFAYGLMGQPSSIQLPPVGSQLREGEKGWSARIDGHVFDVLSPVSGEVIASNDALSERAAPAAADPYRQGWLLRVRPQDRRVAFRNLLPANMGRLWMSQVQSALSSRMGLADTMVLQDGGLPVSGFARHIGGDHWHELVQEFLLTQETRS